MRKGIKYVLMGIGVMVILGAIAARNPVGNTPGIQSAAMLDPGQEERPPIEILQHQPKLGDMQNDNMYAVNARVRNNTSGPLKYIQIRAVFYDKANNVVGTGLGNEANFDAGATKTIDVLAMGIENADHYELRIDNP